MIIQDLHSSFTLPLFLTPRIKRTHPITHQEKLGKHTQLPFFFFSQHTVGMEAASLLTSKLQLCLSADDGSEGVCCYTLVHSSILAFIGIIDQQAPFQQAVAVIHAHVNTAPI